MPGDLRECHPKLANEYAIPDVDFWEYVYYVDCHIHM